MASDTTTRTPPAAPVAPGEVVATADARVIIQPVPWSHFEKQLEIRGDQAGPRIAFLDGALEIMSPSKDHERIKSYIGCLIEAYALERDIDLSPYGAWTLKRKLKRAGVEPDECYLIGDQERGTPDLAIEVVWTSGGLHKLEIYRRLGVREVWQWKDGSLGLYVLTGDDYQKVSQSAVFPDLDVELLATFLDRPTAMQAVKAFRDALRSR